jgi:hypothetical protein
MDVEERIQALEKLVTVNTDRFSAINQQMHTLAVDMGHLKTQANGYQASIDKAVADAERAITTASAAGTSIATVRGDVVDLKNRATSLERAKPIVNCRIFTDGSTSVKAGNYGVKSVEKLDVGFYLIELNEQSTSELVQVTLTSRENDILAHGFIAQTEWVNDTRNPGTTAIQVKCFVVRNDYLSPQVKDPWEIHLLVWR